MTLALVARRPRRWRVRGQIVDRASTGASLLGRCSDVPPTARRRCPSPASSRCRCRAAARRAADPRAHARRRRAPARRARRRSSRSARPIRRKRDADRLRADIQRQLLALAGRAGADAARTREEQTGASHEVPQVRLPRVRARRSLPQLRIRLFADARRPVPDLPLRRRRGAGQPLDDLSLVDAARRAAGRSRCGREAGSRPRARRLRCPRSTARPASPPRRASCRSSAPPIPDDEPLITQAVAAAAAAGRPPRDAGSAAAARRAAARARRSIWRSICSDAPAVDPPVAPALRSTESWSADRQQQATRPKTRRVAARVRRRRHRSADPRRRRRGRHLLHDADLRPRRSRSSASCRRGRCSRFCSCRTAAISSRSPPAGRRSARWPPGIRVVPASADVPLDLGRALAADADVAACSPSRPASASSPPLFSRDHRGLHDRFAGTRVVR